MSDTTRLALPRLEAAQAQKHVTHNDALDLLDALVHLSVVEAGVTAPPAAPLEGACYIVGADPTGAFSGHAQAVAAFDDGGWRFLAPRKGWGAFVESRSRLFVFDGAAWAPLAIDVTALQNMRILGVGTTADANNPFAARLNAALFTALRASDGGSGDLRVKIDKEQSSGTASHIYSTDYSGRAETGLMGDDRFRIKVSPDGGAWKEALNVDPATGRVFFPNGASDLAAAAAVTGGSPSAYTLAAPMRGPLPEGAVFWMVPHAPNATALNASPTLKIDQIDAAPLPLRNFDGGALPQGALDAGKAVLVRKSGAVYCVQTQRSPFALFNLLEDGGRFAGTPEPLSANADAFADVGYFINLNGATRANYGVARAGLATMPAAIGNLLAKIRAPAAQQGGVEFFVMQVTAGDGTTLGVSVQNTSFYQAIGCAGATGRGVTGALYFRVMSGSMVLAPGETVTRMLVDGVAHNFTVNATSRIFTAAHGWKHMQMWVAPANGAVASFWPMRVTPGSVFLIALPAVVPGFETLPWDLGPAPSLRGWR